MKITQEGKQGGDVSSEQVPRAVVNRSWYGCIWYRWDTGTSQRISDHLSRPDW
jgi:hypothetical protein